MLSTVGAPGTLAGEEPPPDDVVATNKPAPTKNANGPQGTTAPAPIGMVYTSPANINSTPL